MDGKDLIAILSITIAISAFVYTRNHNRRSLRISKLEEILEILSFLNSHYPTLIFFSNLAKSIGRLPEESSQYAEEEMEYENSIKHFKNRVGENTLGTKIERLTILAKCYLPIEGKSKFNISANVRIQAIAHLFKNIMLVGIEGALILKDVAYPFGYPTVKNLNQFMANIEEDIIKEMGLGYNADLSNKVDTYKRDAFQTDLGLNNEVEK